MLRLPHMQFVPNLGFVSPLWSRRMMALFIAFALALAVVAPPSGVASASTATIQDFDVSGTGTVCESGQFENPPPPTVLPGGPTGFGNFLRLVSAVPIPTPPSFNTYTCPVTAPASDTIVADFDFRITPGATLEGGAGRADGFSFALLSNEATGAQAEEPNFAGSFGIGFDIYNNTDIGDAGNENILPTFSSSISLHFDGQLLGQVDLTDLAKVTQQIDLAGGRWIHAHVVLRPGAAEPDVIVILTPQNCDPVIVKANLPIPGLSPYPARVYFGARSGGETAHHDIDNIRVQFLPLTQTVLSLSSTAYNVGETSASVPVTVMRSGNAQTKAQVDYTTVNGTAKAGTDYTAVSGTLVFNPGQTKRQFSVPILHNSALEANEIFQVILKNPKGAVVGGPFKAGAKIFDQESARSAGRWNPPTCLPLVAVHTHLLPTKKVLFWDRLGNISTWNPANQQIMTPFRMDQNLFCSGHTFLADGMLLISGGHDHADGGPSGDGMGLKQTVAYDPFADAWDGKVDMNEGRWYPTNTALANGEMLVISGTYNATPPPDPNIVLNLVPQVWQPESETWRDLDDAASQPENVQAHGVKLYPWMFVAPDGTVFKAGPDQDTWFLDTSGGGSWTHGPDRNYGLLSYGSAVMYAPGKILVVGGGDDNTPSPDATNVAEVIDLNEQTPEWRSVAPMTYARRQHNATLLPDGKVLVTGGTSGEGFTNEAEPVLPAELWDPASETWKTLPAMQITRGYHSTALLLPDGRVLVAGGGQGAGAMSFHNEAEIYSPNYLFKGARPKITTAPTVISFGQKFTISTPDPSIIGGVSLVRLPSVTHSFDQSQRFIWLNFTQKTGGLLVTAPASGNEAPPGYYMLFIINGKGVPSVAAMVRVVASAP